MTFNYKTIHLMKLGVFALLCFLLFSNQLLSQNINGYLLFEESKNETASKCELYSSSELSHSSEVTFKIIFSTDNPAPLGKFNQLGAGLAALIVPEDAYVYYKKIKVYYSIYPDREEYKEYKPSSESEKNWWKFVELVISKIPYIGMVTDLKPLYEYSKPDYDNKIDGNEYDMVSADWDTKKLENWRKVKIEIPVRIGQNTNIGLYAFWLTKASNESGPVYQKENTVTLGILDGQILNWQPEFEEKNNPSIINKKLKKENKSVFEENIKKYFRQKYGDGAESIINTMQIEYWDQNNDGIYEARVSEKNMQGRGDDRWYIFQYQPFKALLENKVGWDLMMNNPFSENNQTNGYRDCVLVTYERDNSGQITDHEYIYKWNGSNYVPPSQLTSSAFNNSQYQNTQTSLSSNNDNQQLGEVKSIEGSVITILLQSANNDLIGKKCTIYRNYSSDKIKIAEGIVNYATNEECTIEINETYGNLQISQGDTAEF